MSREAGRERVTRRAGRTWAGTLGTAGSVACGISMILIAAAIPALLAGAVLYAGMYRQASLLVMDASIAAGYTAWIALYRWARGGHSSRAPARHATATIADGCSSSGVS